VGNKVGWVLAGILTGGLVIIFLLVFMFPPPSAATSDSLAKGLLEFKDMSISPAEIVGTEGAAAGNAGDDYHLAVKLHKQNEWAIKTELEDPDRQAGKKLSIKPDILDLLKRIHAHVAAGAAKKQMQYAFVHTPKKFEVGFLYPPAKDLDDIAWLLEELARYHGEQKQYALAEKIVKDELVMGRHMMNERSRADMVMVGVGIQHSAVKHLAHIYKNHQPERAEVLDALKRYERELVLINRPFRRKERILRSLKPEPGDVFNIIENDKDRCWRVQGLLCLGVLRYTASSRGDKRYIRKLIQRYLDSDEPMEAAAAAAARDLTREGFNQVGSRH